MSLIKSVELPNGVIVNQATHRIESVTIGYKNKAFYTVRVYVDTAKPAFTEFTGEMTYCGGDVYAECYAHMKQDGGYVDT